MGHFPPPTKRCPIHGVSYSAAKAGAGRKEDVQRDGICLPKLLLGMLDPVVPGVATHPPDMGSSGRMPDKGDAFCSHWSLSQPSSSLPFSLPMPFPIPLRWG